MTQAFEHDAFMAAWRGARHPDGRKIVQAEYALVMAAIDGTWSPPPAARPGDPAWVAVARVLLGTREIKGPTNTALIAKGWARLGAPWFNDDETPWCGWFVGHCVDAAGLPYPGKGEFARAKAWLNWGKPCPPAVGAVVVFSRAGGGHVGFLVGESATHYYVLGGNQDNMVSIAPFNKVTRKPEGFRWPVSLPLPDAGGLPKMSGGTVTGSEA